MAKVIEPSKCVGVSGMGKMRTGIRARRNCSLLETIGLVTAGWGRAVCQACGHLSVHYLQGGMFATVVTISADPIPQTTTRA
ncbi:MAG: hypothetical protein IIC72_11365 [Acidobacteria bacterium]|nr:hypothetical protein [Acidobacteriota bacterium]